VTGDLLVDNSAWARLRAPTLPHERALEIASALDRGTIVACLPFLLEVGYSARDRAHHARTKGELALLPRVLIDPGTEARALAAQEELILVGHHRLSLRDLIIAALADRHGLGILHYDADYDVIHEHTDLDFESVWLAPSGTL
jgi:predicted nucleic acid-binding protein